MLVRGSSSLMLVLGVLLSLSYAYALYQLTVVQARLVRIEVLTGNLVDVHTDDLKGLLKHVNETERLCRACLTNAAE